jgi:hypothetical protein
VREHGSLVEVFVYGSGRIASWISVGAARGSGSAANSGAAMRRCLARRTAIRPISTPTGAAPSTAVMPGLGKGSGDSRVMAALDQRHAAAATRTAVTGKCSQLAQARPVGGAGAAPAARSRRRRGDRDGGQQRPGAEKRRCPRRSGRRRARRTSRRWPARARPRRAARWASSGHRAATRRGRRVGLGRAQGAELDCGGQHRGEDGEQRGHRQHAQLATTIAGYEGVVLGVAAHAPQHGRLAGRDLDGLDRLPGRLHALISTGWAAARSRGGVHDPWRQRRIDAHQRADRPGQRLSRPGRWPPRPTRPPTPESSPGLGVRPKGATSVLFLPGHRHPACLLVALSREARSGAKGRGS